MYNSKTFSYAAIYKHMLPNYFKIAKVYFAFCSKLL